MPTDQPTSLTEFIHGTCPHGHTRTFPAVRETCTPEVEQDLDGHDTSQAPTGGMTLTCNEHDQPVTWRVATPDRPPAPPGRLQQLQAHQSKLRARHQAAGAQLADAVLAEVNHRILERFPTAGLLHVNRQTHVVHGQPLRIRTLIDVHGHVLADSSRETASVKALADAVGALLDEVAALSPNDIGETHLKVAAPYLPRS